jgi:hypothetical protein
VFGNNLSPSSGEACLLQYVAKELPINTASYPRSTKTSSLTLRLTHVRTMENRDLDTCLGTFKKSYI